jgi:hypothetical protein
VIPSRKRPYRLTNNAAQQNSPLPIPIRQRGTSHKPSRTHGTLAHKPVNTHNPGPTALPINATRSFPRNPCQPIISQTACSRAALSTHSVWPPCAGNMQYSNPYTLAKRKHLGPFRK